MDLHLNQIQNDEMLTSGTETKFVHSSGRRKRKITAIKNDNADSESSILSDSVHGRRRNVSMVQQPEESSDNAIRLLENICNESYNSQLCRKFVKEEVNDGNDVTSTSKFAEQSIHEAFSHSEVESKPLNDPSVSAVSSFRITPIHDKNGRLIGFQTLFNDFGSSSSESEPQNDDNKNTNRTSFDKLPQTITTTETIISNHCEDTGIVTCSSSSGRQLRSNSRYDVTRILQYYVGKTNKDLLIADKENITKDSPMDWISTQKSALLIIYNENIYKPIYERKDGLVILKCTFGKCKGSATTDRITGEVKIQDHCIDHDRSEEITKKLVQREALIYRLNGARPKEVLMNARLKLGDKASDVLGTEKTFSQKIRRQIHEQSSTPGEKLTNLNLTLERTSNQDINVASLTKESDSVDFLATYEKIVSQIFDEGKIQNND